MSSKKMMILGESGPSSFSQWAARVSRDSVEVYTYVRLANNTPQLYPIVGQLPCNIQGLNRKSRAVRRSLFPFRLLPPIATTVGELWSTLSLTLFIPISNFPFINDDAPEIKYMAALEGLGVLPFPSSPRKDKRSTSLLGGVNSWGISQLMVCCWLMRRIMKETQIVSTLTVFGWAAFPSFPKTIILFSVAPE